MATKIPLTKDALLARLDELVEAAETVERSGGHVTYIVATSGFYTEVKNLVKEYRAAPKPAPNPDPYKKRLADIAELTRTLTWDDQSCEQKNCREAHNCALTQVYALAVAPVEPAEEAAS